MRILPIALPVAASFVAFIALHAEPAPEAAVATIRAAGGILIAYPRSWRAAAMRDGTVIGIAAPATSGPRPAVTILLAKGQGDIHAVMQSAEQGMGRGAAVRLLGERRMGSSRVARYYLRGPAERQEYVVVGVAQGGGWIATLVAVDTAADPALRERAAVFQRILADLRMPPR